MKYKITIFTPTYNRAYILEQLYRSIKQQTFPDFEWLIIDDGSTDNTEELVHHWIDEKNAFPICYYKQSNGGKCRAINRALELARGELFFVVDSDDYLTKDALEKIDEWEKQLPKDKKYCGVSGNLGTDENHTDNHLFTEGFLDGNLLDRYSSVDGERAYAFYTQVHRRYTYPVFHDEKFMTEAVTYNRMAHDGFKMRFYNDIICIYEYREDGLTYSGNQLFLDNPKGYGLWLREKNGFMGAGRKDTFLLWYAFYCEMNSCDEKSRLTKKQIAEYIGAPLWGIYVSDFLHRMKRIIKR